jgi:cardiolipin synthase
METREPSDAILTVPNLLTFFRLGLVPVFLWVGLGPDRMDLALSIAVLGVLTDLADGRIARRYGQISRLGVALDPLADRLALASGAVVLIVHELAPLWAILLVLGRDVLLVVVGLPILKAAGAPIPPVSLVGKIGSFAISVTFALFLASGIPDVADQNDLRGVAIALAVVSMPLYYVSALGYVRAGIEALRAKRGGDGSSSRG